MTASFGSSLVPLAFAVWSRDATRLQLPTLRLDSLPVKRREQRGLRLLRLTCGSPLVLSPGPPVRLGGCLVSLEVFLACGATSPRASSLVVFDTPAFVQLFWETRSPLFFCFSSRCSDMHHVHKGQLGLSTLMVSGPCGRNFCRSS